MVVDWIALSVVLYAKSQWLDLEHVRELIHELLETEEILCRGRTPARDGTLRIRQHLVQLDLHMGALVEMLGTVRASHSYTELLRIRTRLPNDLVIDRGQGPVLFHSGPDDVARSGAVMPGDKLLVPVHEEAHRSASPLGEHGSDDMVRFQAVFAAKAPTGVFIDDADAVDRQAQSLGEAVLDHMNTLVRVPEDQLLALPTGHTAGGF